MSGACGPSLRLVAATMRIRRDSGGRGSFLLRRLVAGACLALLAAAPVEGYRFLPESHESSLVPTRSVALEWRRSVWRPGGTLVWWLADDPDWSVAFGEPVEAAAIVEQALEAWTAIPTADIRWRLDGVTNSPGKGLDGRNTVSVEDDNDAHGTGPVSYVRIWHEWAPGRRRWETVECDVVMSSRAAGHLDELPAYKFLIHEFGHCLGLNHAAVTPTPHWGWDWTDSTAWYQDPAMSYGVHRDRIPSPDDALGASLLRPAPGWLPTTGGITGTVLLDDQPARFASVSALRLAGGALREVGAVFSDESGRFVLEGLRPGIYVLWIHPLRALDAHKWLLREGAETHFTDLAIPWPFRTTAGQETDAGVLALSSGRGPPAATGEFDPALGRR